MAEKKPINFQWAINHGIAEEMRRDPSVFIVGEDVGKPGGPFGVTRGLFKSSVLSDVLIPLSVKVPSWDCAAARLQQDFAR